MTSVCLNACMHDVKSKCDVGREPTAGGEKNVGWQRVNENVHEELEGMFCVSLESFIITLRGRIRVNPETLSRDFIFIVNELL